TLIGGAVDTQQAVVTDSDPAEQPTRLAFVARRTPGTYARGEQRGTDGLARLGVDRAAVEIEAYAARIGHDETTASKRSGANGSSATAGVAPVSACAISSPVPA